jgi:hypothetical protein
MSYLKLFDFIICMLLCNLYVIYFNLPVVLFSVYILEITNKLKHKNEITRQVYELARIRYELSMK